jgi:uncharacterized protein
LTSVVFLVFAGVLAGVVGTAGGITSLVSYPALLAVGISPFAANVTNAVSLIASGLAASASSGLELRDHGRRLRAWAPIAAAGGVSGAVLLLVTPPGVFAWIVPALIAFASVLLLVQPRITARSGTAGGHRHRAAVAAGVFAACAYSGYFGAGAGVLIIAMLLLFVEPDLPRANALKNVLLTIADILPGLIFAVAGPVSWRAAIPLAVGASVGGAIGPRVTRRVPHRILRVVVATMGLGLATWLVVSQLD